MVKQKNNNIVKDNSINFIFVFMKPFYFVCKCNIYSNDALFQFTLLCAFLKKEKKKPFVSWGEDGRVPTSHPPVQLKNTRSEENGYNNINN